MPVLTNANFTNCFHLTKQKLQVFVKGFVLGLGPDVMCIGT